MLSYAQFQEAVLSGHYETPPEHSPSEPLKVGFRSWWRFYVGGIAHALSMGRRIIREGGMRQSLFGDLGYCVTRAVESTGAKVTFEGFDRLLPIKGRPAVVVANHMSLMETMLLPAGLVAANDLTVIAKRSLTRYPYFGHMLSVFRPILLDRKNPRKDLADTLSQGMTLLADGITILLFPQGHRSEVFDPRIFNSLGAKLATRANVPLVPVACKTDIARPGRIVKDFGPIDPSRPVRFACGPVIDPGTSQREMQETCTSFISSTLSGWGMAVAQTQAEQEGTNDVKGN